MNDLKITVKDIITFVSILAGVFGAYYTGKFERQINKEGISNIDARVNVLEGNDRAQDITITTIVTDVKHIKEQTQAIYDRVVLGGVR